MGPQGPVTGSDSVFPGGSICPIILVRFLSHTCDVSCSHLLHSLLLLIAATAILCFSRRVLPSERLNHFLVFSSLSQGIFAGILPRVVGSCHIAH